MEGNGQFHGAWQCGKVENYCVAPLSCQHCVASTHACNSVTVALKFHATCKFCCTHCAGVAALHVAASFFSQRSAVRIKDSITRWVLIRVTFFVSLTGEWARHVNNNIRKRIRKKTLQQAIKMMDDTLIVNLEVRNALQRNRKEIAKQQTTKRQ